MTISVKHPNVSGRKITPADYASEHEMTLTGAGLLGSVAAGAVGHIPLGSGLSFSGGSLIATGGGGGGSSIFINVKDYGAVGDGLTNDLPAFEAALAAAKALASSQNGALHKGTPKVYVPTPAQHYYLASSLNINICVHLFGDGSGAPNTSGTLLRFGDNCSGIIVNEYRTYGNGLGSVGDGSGSLIEGFTLYSGNVSVNGSGVPTIFGDGTSGSGHGVNVRGIGVRLHDIQCFFWPENGIYIHADSNGGQDSEQGNANNWRIQDIWCQYNDGSGIMVYGADANSGTGINVNGVSNRVAGIYDKSFLGNTWIQPHTRDNGIISYTGLNLPTGMCSYPTSATCYSVAYGKNALASTTVPGTDSTVWIPVANSHPSAKPWVTGMTWEVGAPILVTNINARSMFINPYAESAQGVVQSTGNTMFLNGLMALGDDPIAGIDGTKGLYTFAGSGALNAPGMVSTAPGSYLGGDARFGITGSGFSHKLTTINANGKASWSAANGVSGSSVFTIDNFSDAQPFCFTLARLRVANFGDGAATGGGWGLNFISATSQVVGQLLLNGDVFFNTSTTSGSNTHWYCDATGVAASGAVLKPSGIRGGVQAATVAAPTGGATIDTECRDQLAAVLTALKNAKLMAS